MCHIDTVTGKHLHTFGLRILFGAAMAMQSAESKKLQPEDDPFRWHNFLNLFETFASLSALDAVVILREVYGDNRRVLVLVDELSKIARHDQADDAVVGEIGHILDSLDYADVIVSSLSPQYAEALLTGSGRSVLHVMLESLIKYGLGHEECMDWANRLLSQLGKSEIEVDKFAIRFLQSIDLLLSGHPRSLEHLVSQFANDSAWNSTIDTLRFTESKVHFPTMLRSVLMDLLASRSILRPKGLDLAVLEESLNFFVKETSDYRFLLERGSVLVIPQSKFTSSFRTTISLLSFFSLVGDFKLQDRGLDPRVFAASVLFGDVFRSNKTSIGQLFEHAVALTVVCYSHVTKLDLLTAGAWLGCPYYMNNRLPLVPPGLTTRIARTIEDMLIPAGGPQTNELVVAFDNCPGFDSVVTLMASEDSPAHTIYLEQKVSAVQDPNTMRISKLVSALQFHYLCTRAMKKDAQLDSFKHMHMLFYEWGADSADTPTVSKAAVIAAVSSYFAELERTAEPRAATKGKSFRSKPQGLQYDSLLLSMSKSKTHLRRMRNCFDAYLSADGDAVTVRARVIGRSDLEEWLVPPMAPIPLLVESVLASDVTKTSE